MTTTTMLPLDLPDLPDVRSCAAEIRTAPDRGPVFVLRCTRPGEHRGKPHRWGKWQRADEVSS